MGIYNRDYLRDSASGGGHRMPTAEYGGMTRRIVILTVAVFILQLLFPPVTRWLQVDFEAIAFRGQIWRILTYAFCHAPNSLLHIVFNLWMFWLFGREVEAMYGAKEFTWFYCVSAVFAGVCYLALGMVFNDLVPMLGASGAIMAVCMVYTLHYPRRTIRPFGLFDLEMRWLMAILVISDLYPILLRVGHGVTEGDVAHAAHLGGVLFGTFYFVRQIRLSSLVRGVGLGGGRRLPRRKSKLKLFTPPPETRSPPPKVAGEQVDAILAKISEQGEASLTDREREVLKQASKQYRDR